MAQARLEIKATADTTQATRALKDLSIQGVNVANALAEKSRESIKSIIGAFNPLTVVGAAVANIVNRLIDGVVDFGKRMLNFKQAYAELGEDIAKTAQTLKTTTSEAVRLEAAANAAGVSAKAYAEALENIKSGKTTLAEQAEAWERIAGASKVAASQKEALAGIIAQGQQRRQERLGRTEQIGAILGGLGVHGEIAQTFFQEILNGRTASITGKDYIRRAQALGVPVMSLGRDTDSMQVAIESLNGFIAERLRGEAERLRGEDMQREAQKAQEAATAKAETARDVDTYKYARQLVDAGMTLDKALHAIAQLEGRMFGEVEASYANGERNAYTPRERLLMRAKSDNEEAIRQYEEEQKEIREDEERKRREADEKRKADEKRQKEASDREAKEEERQGKIADVKEWARLAREEAQGSYRGGYDNSFGLMAGADSWDVSEMAPPSHALRRSPGPRGRSRPPPSRGSVCRGRTGWRGGACRRRRDPGRRGCRRRGWR